MEGEKSRGLLKSAEARFPETSLRNPWAFLLLAEYGDDVLEYYDQPSPPIQLEYLDKRGHRQRPFHTADYFVLSYHEAGWQECKPVQELTRQSQERPNRYVLDEHGTWRCPPGEAFAERLGLTYRVRASDQINWVAQDNWLFLDEYFQDLERLMVPEETLETLQRMVDEHPGITLADLHRELPEIPTDLINIAIAKHQLYVDLLTHRLTDRERTPLYRNEQTARAFTHRVHASLDLDTLAHPVVIEQGRSNPKIVWSCKRTAHIPGPVAASQRSSFMIGGKSLPPSEPGMCSWTGSASSPSKHRRIALQQTI